MPIEILMPALSPTMKDGTLVTWHKKEGDSVESGDLLAEIETDKATMEVEAVDEGTLGKILVPAGSESVKVNEVIALLLEEGEEPSSIESYVPKQNAPAQNLVDPAEPFGSQEKEGASSSLTERNVPQVFRETVDSSEIMGGRIKASPLAKRIAEELGIDVRSVAGSGPYGRIIKRDVEGKAGSPQNHLQKVPHGPAFRDEKLSSMRKVIANRLTESKQTVPHFYLTIDCEIEDLLKARKSINEGFEGVKVSVNDFVIRAIALALQDVPEANASYHGDFVRFYRDSDISVAVALEGGLITPILKMAQVKGILEISKEMKSLAARARDGKLKPEEFQGGSFSLSNLGMFGVREFSAVINPPQACILAVGAGEKRAVVEKDGNIVPKTLMTCTLSVDHRVVDGKVGADFLAAFKSYMENPIRMILEA